MQAALPGRGPDPAGSATECSRPSDAPSIRSCSRDGRRAGPSTKVVAQVSHGPVSPTSSPDLTRTARGAA